MSINTLSLLKLKKKCQETFYQSVNDVLNVFNSQTYIPIFSDYTKFENNFSKQMFILNSKYILLEFIKNDINENIINNNNVDIDDNDDNVNNSNFDNINLNEIKNKSSDVSEKFKINESIQGIIKCRIVDKEIYIKSKDYSDYKNHITDIDVFIKSNPLLDVINYMENKYEFNNGIPSSFSNLTNSKVNSKNNNAYIEVLCCYYLGLLYQKNLTTLFPIYFGSFNGLANNYIHDISEDYPLIRDCDWFKMTDEKLGYEVIRDNNLDGFDDLSLDDVKLVDYDEEQNLKKGNLNLEGEKVSNNTSLNIDLELELDNIYSNKKRIDEENKKKEKNKNLKNLIENLHEKYNENDNDNDKSSEESNSYNEESDNSDNWSDINSDYSSSIDSNISCIMSDTYIKIKNFPIQVLVMEKFDKTLTDLDKEGLSCEEWKSILFEICFGLAVSQKHLDFVHNDLHSDNIMFKDIKKQYKYYHYKEKGIYFKVPTFNRETKIIDFARGIIKIGKNHHFSDVFKKEGDAYGQYGDIESNKNIHKKINYSFDLARLGTALFEYLDLEEDKKEIYEFIYEWTKSKDGTNFINEEDDFKIYVEICDNAYNAIPKKQLNKSFFEEYIIKKSNIPKKEIIYEL